MWAVFAAVQQVINKLTTMANTSVIKSIQHFCVLATENITSQVAISTVVSTKSFVTVSYEGSIGVTVELNTDGTRVDVSRGPEMTGNTAVQFSVIEFY